MPIGDQIGKQTADELIAQLPELKAFIAEQLAQLQATVKQITADTKDELNVLVGGSLADITTERTQAIRQAEDAIHSVLDRINLPQLINARKTTTD